VRIVGAPTVEETSGPEEPLTWNGSPELPVVADADEIESGTQCRYDLVGLPVRRCVVSGRGGVTCPSTGVKGGQMWGSGSH